MVDDSGGPAAQEVRYKHFLAAMETYCIDVGDYEEEVEEDIRPYVEGCLPVQVPLSQFMAITYCLGNHMPYKSFFYPIFDTFEDAMDRAERFINDDACQEFPKAVLDLDTGLYRNAALEATWNHKWSTTT